MRIVGCCWCYIITMIMCHVPECMWTCKFTIAVSLNVCIATIIPGDSKHYELWRGQLLALLIKIIIRHPASVLVKTTTSFLLYWRQVWSNEALPWGPGDILQCFISGSVEIRLRISGLATLTNLQASFLARVIQLEFPVWFSCRGSPGFPVLIVSDKVRIIWWYIVHIY